MKLSYTIGKMREYKTKYSHQLMDSKLSCLIMLIFT